MSPVPAIFLAFANDDEEHLELLPMERRGIREALGILERKEKIKVVEHSELDPAGLVGELQSYEDQLTIFHYGGHADSQRLRMAGGDAHSKGLASLLGAASNLKLVFLNGCSTYDQVQELMDQGVGAVIATSVPVGDPPAKDFAIAFYQGLAAGKTVRKSFHNARNAIATTGGSDVQIEEDVQFRGVKFTPTDPVPVGPGSIPVPAPVAEAIPWALYCKKERKKILNWKLPSFMPVTPLMLVLATFAPLYLIVQGNSLFFQGSFFDDWRLSMFTSLAIAIGALSLLMWQRLLRRRHSMRYALTALVVLAGIGSYYWTSLAGNVVLQVALPIGQFVWLKTPVAEGAAPNDTLVFEARGRRLAAICFARGGSATDDACPEIGSTNVILAERSVERLYAAADSFNHNLVGDQEPSPVPVPATSGGGETPEGDETADGAVGVAVAGDTWRSGIPIKPTDLLMITSYVVGHREAERKRRAGGGRGSDTSEAVYACELADSPTIDLLLRPRKVAYCALEPMPWSEVKPAAGAQDQ